MDISHYEKSEHFERNRAIYVMCVLDGTPLDFVALNFNMNVQDVEAVIATHKKYEELMG